jgi:hypothetical protein
MHFTGGRQYLPNRKAESCCLGHTNVGDHSIWELILKPRFMGKPLTTIVQLAIEKIFLGWLTKLQKSFKLAKKPNFDILDGKYCVDGHLHKCYCTGFSPQKRFHRCLKHR